MIEEHVFGAAQSDAFSAKRNSLLGLRGAVSVGADVELANLVGPNHQLLELLEDLGLGGSQRLVNEHLDHFGWVGVHFAGDDFASEAVDAEPVAVMEDMVAHREGTCLVVDLQRRAADNADLTHLA